MKNIKIIVATHKKADMPKDKVYLSLLVGASLRKKEDGSVEDFGYERDDNGENISIKNDIFGTQTALYWAWKNLDADYIGLVHYRRYFVMKKGKNMIESAIKYDELEPMTAKYKVFVPKKRHYYIETLSSHYAHTLSEQHFPIVEKIIERECPEYLPSFRKVMNRRWGYMFNLMILRKDLFDDYCSWLFNILFKAEKKISKKNMTAFEKRFGGRISEILFDVWLENKIETNVITKDEIKELPYMENVNWPFKIKTFLMAKFFHKKYNKSS